MARYAPISNISFDHSYAVLHSNATLDGGAGVMYCAHTC